MLEAAIHVATTTESVWFVFELEVPSSTPVILRLPLPSRRFLCWALEGRAICYFPQNVGSDKVHQSPVSCCHSSDFMLRLSYLIVGKVLLVEQGGI